MAHRLGTDRGEQDNHYDPGERDQPGAVGVIGLGVLMDEGRVGVPD